jgi:hypothetical protein
LTATNGVAVVDKVRAALAEAEAAGLPKPGRPALVKATGATEHQVRKALEDLAGSYPASSSSAVTSDSEPPPATAEHGHQPAPTAPDMIELQPSGAPAKPATFTRTPPGSPAGGWAGDGVTSPPPARHQPITSGPITPWPVAPRRLTELNQQMAATIQSASSPEPPPAPRQPAARAPRPWPLALIGLAAAVAVWSGWVGLGTMAGFGVIQPLPGIADGFRLNTAIVLPISVEAYAAYALRVWLSTSTHSARTVRFARTSAIASLVIGAAAQVAYHLMAAAGYTRAPWPVVMLVAIIPVVVLGLASALAKLVTSDRQAGESR